MIGETREQPFYMKLVRDEENKVKWGNIIVLTLLTCASGFLAAKAQRAGSNPDIIKAWKMTTYKGLEKYCMKESAGWYKAATYYHNLYEIASL